MNVSSVDIPRGSVLHWMDRKDSWIDRLRDWLLKVSLGWLSKGIQNEVRMVKDL